MRKKIFLVLSVISLLNIMLIPTFDVWGGIFPGKIDYDFFYAIEAFFTDRDSWSEWVVIFSMSIFIPSILMLLISLFDSKAGFTITSLLGLTSELYVLALYISQNEMYEVLPSDDCSIAIGTWTALLIFIISLFVGIKSRKKSSSKDINQSNVSVVTNNSVNQVVIERGSFCPNCGKKIDRQSPFCGNCGYEF